MCSRCHPLSYSSHETVKAKFSDVCFSEDPLYDKIIVCLQLLKKGARLWLFVCQDNMSGKKNKIQGPPLPGNCCNLSYWFLGFTKSVSCIYLVVALFTLWRCLTSFVCLHLNDQMFFNWPLLSICFLSCVIVVLVLYLFTCCNCSRFGRERLCFVANIDVFE